MSHSFMTFISHYGYAAVFALLFVGIVGLPLPVELLLLGVGTIALKTNLHIVWIVFFAWLGASAGMTLNYALGRSVGLKRIGYVTKWVGLSESKLEKWADSFTKYGFMLVLFGYFVAGLRHASPFIAGAIRMRFSRFLWTAYAGALGWILILVLVGQKVGQHWHQLFAFLHHPVGIVVLALIGIGTFCIKSRLRQRRFS